MNLEHLNNLEQFPSFTKQARSVKARQLKEIGKQVEGIMAARTAEGKALAEQGKQIKDLTTQVAKSRRNAAWIGTGTAIGGGALGGGIGWGLNSITPPDHAADNTTSSATAEGDANNKNNKKEETDWIDNTANSISEFYEKHPAVAWGGTALAGLGGLYGLYNALDDEDEDEDY